MGPRSEERGDSGPAVTGHFHDRAASMGPRSEERGDSLTVLASTSASIWLQWGRVPKNAEMYEPHVLMRMEAMLQWGRVPKNAEITACPAR